MDAITQEQPTRKRRYLRVWTIIGAVGLITGAAYASGFAITPPGTATDLVNGAAAPVLGTAGAPLSSLYSGTVETENPLNITTFDGVYGIIGNTDLFEVDLNGPDPYGNSYSGTYFVDVFVTNWEELNAEWSQLNFKVLRSAADVACGDATYFTAPTFDEQLAVDRVDAHVTFSGLVGGETYCIGVAAETAETQADHLISGGGVIDGTFITRPDSATPPAVGPQFMAVVNRSA